MTDPTMRPEAVTARRLQLLRGIMGGAHALGNGSGGDRDSAPMLEGVDSGRFAGPDDADAATRQILVVDDEPVVLALTSRMLRDAEYGVLQASSAREALRLLEAGDPSVDLVLTDVVMPETDGRMLGRLICERYPHLPVAYMSAYSIDDVFHRGSPGPTVPFLSKPFSPEALVALVRTALSQPQSSSAEKEITQG
jgi:CheY-like chemotaxis protein